MGAGILTYIDPFLNPMPGKYVIHGVFGFAFGVDSSTRMPEHFILEM